MLEERLLSIKEHLQQDAYSNEEAVKSAIILPVLQELGWNTMNPNQVWPEYNLGGLRVDYGLCINKKPSVIVEVKAVGNLKEADRQLFEYAFHAGTPLALLTDGREWHVYYAHGKGDYPDRLVRRLNISDQPLDEVTHYLTRYLTFAEVKSERAEANARKDLQDKANRDSAKKAIPKAWRRLVVHEPDGVLVDLLIEETAQEAGGGAPNKDDVIAFLQNLTSPEMQSLPQTPPRPVRPQRPAHKPRRKTTKGSISYTLLGETKTSSTHIDAYVDIIDSLARRDSHFLDRLAARFGGKQLSPHTELHNSKRIHGGWYLNRDLGGRPKEERLKIACKVAGITYGRDLIIDFSVSAEPQSETSQFPQKPAPSPFFNARDKQSVTSLPQKNRRETASYTFSTSIGSKKLTAIRAYVEIMSILARRDPDFLNRLALELGEKHLSRDTSFQNSAKIEEWFLNKTLSKHAQEQKLEIACKVAGIEFGKGLIINFSPSAKSQNVSYTLETSNTIKAYVEVMDSLARRDPDFLNRLAPILGKMQLLRTTDFHEFEKTSWRPVAIYGDWFLNKNIDNPSKKRHLEKACEVAGIEFGKDLIINFPNA